MWRAASWETISRLYWRLGVLTADRAAVRLNTLAILNQSTHFLASFVRFFTVIPLAGCLFGQYSGPAILARGEAPAAMLAPTVSFRPFLQISTVYDTGLSDVRLTDDGELASSSSWGLRASLGVSGAHSWKRTRLGLDYRGSYSNYRQSGVSNAYDHSFLLSVNERVSRRVNLNLRESMGLFTRDFGIAGLSQTIAFDPTSSYIPTTDFFDNRTIYLTTQADLNIQTSLRMSFNIGGDLFINRRHSSALSGAAGESARGDVHYRISRRSTAGASYNFHHYSYTGTNGGSDIHSISGSFAIALTRRLEFSGTAGISRVESKFIQVFEVDRVIAELLGIRSTEQIVHQLRTRPSVNARMSRVFRTGVVYVSGASAVTPGNGLFLTSYTESFMGGYSYTGLRRWSISASVSKTLAEAVGSISGNYGGLTTTGSLSRTLRYGLNFTAAVSARRYESSDFNKYNRLIYNATVGIGFTPGNIPLRIW
jgi:hypothetical protein